MEECSTNGDGKIGNLQAKSEPQLKPHILRKNYLKVQHRHIENKVSNFQEENHRISQGSGQGKDFLDMTSKP